MPVSMNRSIIDAHCIIYTKVSILLIGTGCIFNRIRSGATSRRPSRQLMATINLWYGAGDPGIYGGVPAESGAAGSKERVASGEIVTTEDMP